MSGIIVSQENLTQTHSATVGRLFGTVIGVVIAVTVGHLLSPLHAGVAVQMAVACGTGSGGGAALSGGAGVHVDVPDCVSFRGPWNAAADGRLLSRRGSAAGRADRRLAPLDFRDGDCRDCAGKAGGLRSAGQPGIGNEYRGPETRQTVSIITIPLNSRNYQELVTMSAAEPVLSVAEGAFRPLSHHAPCRIPAPFFWRKGGTAQGSPIGNEIRICRHGLIPAGAIVGVVVFVNLASSAVEAHSAALLFHIDLELAPGAAALPAVIVVAERKPPLAEKMAEAAAGTSAASQPCGRAQEQNADK